MPEDDDDEEVSTIIKRRHDTWHGGNQHDSENVSVMPSVAMEQHALRSVNDCLNTNIYSYLETSGVQSYNLYSNVVHFFNTSLN